MTEPYWIHLDPTDSPLRQYIANILLSQLDKCIAKYTVKSDKWLPQMLLKKVSGQLKVLNESNRALNAFNQSDKALHVADQSNGALLH